MSNLDFIYEYSNSVMFILIFILVAIIVVFVRMTLTDDIFSYKSDKLSLYSLGILTILFIATVVTSIGEYSEVEDSNINKIQPWLKEQGISIRKEKLKEVLDDGGLESLFAKNPDELLATSNPFKTNDKLYILVWSEGKLSLKEI